MRLCPILMYHWFRAEGATSGSRSPQLEITPSLFAEQMDWLKGKGYRTISLARALGLDGGTPPGGREVVLTFDDGTLDFWERARPVLDSHGFTATLFVVSAHVGGHSTWDRHLGEPDRPLMAWEQIRELHGAGYEIGSHTHTHRSLTEVSDDEARDEFDRSRAILERQLGRAPRFVAYPRGQYTGRHKQLARRAGYYGACAVILGWGDLWRGERYELKRMTIKGSESMLRFRTKLALCRLVRYPDTERDPS
jgi:peptidoglycan/xylan/chitin deacetylase (PgdA/CDA1 family)